MEYTIRNNAEFGSIEVMFAGKPAAEIRDALKALRFRWHGVKKCWYGYTDEETIRAALDGKTTAAAAPAKVKKAAAEVERSHGLKVGDLFYASWGYEQTNIDFFQILELVGKNSVRVRQVCPKCIAEDGVSWASANRSYEIPDSILPPSSFSVMIEDNEHGDLKRVKVDGDRVSIKVGKSGGYQTSAWPYAGQELYESWYA